jgi:hypothetical protein
MRDFFIDFASPSLVVAGREIAVQADERRVAGLEVDVGDSGNDDLPEQVVDLVLDHWAFFPLAPTRSAL